MADVRSLLKAKRQELRVEHPLAAYTSSGQLRCVACDAPVKHSSAWEGHVGSKAHRLNAAKHREAERAARLRAQAVQAAQDADAEPVHGKRRAADDEMDTDDVLPEKKRRIEQAASARGLPTDFFSDRALAPADDGGEEDEEEELPAANKNPPAEVDLEWQQFQEAVLNPPDERDAYERATVFAEPELAPDGPEGFPPGLQGGEGDVEQPAEETEGAKRRRREIEDRELIMDRLLEEERVQEEADAKVAMLKSKLDLIRRQREARKAGKAKNS